MSLLVKKKKKKWCIQHEKKFLCITEKRKRWFVIFVIAGRFLERKKNRVWEKWGKVVRCNVGLGNSERLKAMGSKILEM